MATPRKIRFCWLCGRKLQGNYYAEIEVDAHIRILHKSCAKIANTEAAEEYLFSTGDANETCT
jgi:hypothetical protein